MLSKLKKSNNKGFTIIEVMIVLAIAGLILLIVFLAVPALQRSSRNTQRKTDVGRIGSGATTIVSNNNGSISAASLTAAALTAEAGNLSYYTAAGAISSQVIASGNVANTTDDAHVVVVGNAACTVGNAAGPALYTARQIAILYSVESGSGITHVCVDE